MSNHWQKTNAQELKAAGFNVILGEQTPDLLDAGYDLIVKILIPYDASCKAGTGLKVTDYFRNGIDWGSR